MLNYISIKNIVLIDKLELNFEQGFTVLTGETGAGKSIIVDAINLILGNRADKSLIKKGEKEASVSALFIINKDHDVINLLDKYSLKFENDIILRRKILSNGRSQSFLNDELISLSVMKEISNYLIEVNGQNDQVGLLENSNHINILDEWGNLSKNTKGLSISYKLYKDKVKSFNEYKEKLELIEDKKKYLIEDLDEINKLELKDNEINTLIEKKNYLMSIEKIKDSLGKINFLLKGNIESQGVYENLVLSKKQILSILPLNKELFKKLDASIESTLIEYKETEAILEECLESVDISNLNLDDIENRISLIKRIARKHNIDESEIINFKNQLEKNLYNFANSLNDLKKMEEEINILRKKYIEGAEQLTNLRQEAANKLSKYVNKEFPVLKLDNASFKVSINLLDEISWKSNGMDDVTFKIETNKDSGFNFIAKIASGGELSRIMLAIKVSLSSERKNNSTKTLIFDEVDSGVGGAVADAIGKRLNLLGLSNQVLAVTHHPQVAARSKNHFKVNKSNENSYSTTSIKNLNYDERLEEIARMLSGEKVTEAARHAAESLMNHN
ncbi:MAG: DNA repair protein RecN [Alphaproteobacteria bacterium MarineAlpha9_Bin3]|nr:MAG: DNA repair protein RecN [Alphaproteobacteria bacterium MarineAlpha9_Bin3]|tara:strand:+ start:3167 stop:4849 length:1683 start_codon:yes stop_codon:yes gene_type:complete